ncbi:GntR family transcriptional regulator [Actinoallomurus iriomotensis]|jgi:DNA-binding GntR family transcriptional regulator|uniref:Transcriptional regulator n=1 Tax=Actinoallomurus iriomotensis TaxID=478107 RepID=A0A9W6RUD6_9ACTN|nr:GntR family transcriptional regulator [Actinoallomurus iriomotensis]GLY82036.1 transcriptional regulator [Actinoallomurus iriomotensis]
MSFFTDNAESVDMPRLTRPAPLREGVYEALLELIVTRVLKPGQHLVESDLATRLGISRQPVREALQRLSTEGWVDLRPAQGAFVHTPTEEEADQLLAVRSLLEAESARLAAANVTPEAIARLREICERGVAALDADEVDAVVAANAELHAAIVELAGNKVLAELAAQVDRRVRWYYTPVARQRGPESWTEHAALIDALAAHDGERAAQIMREHTEHTRRSYHQRPDREVT